MYYNYFILSSLSEIKKNPEKRKQTLWWSSSAKIHYIHFCAQCGRQRLHVATLDSWFTVEILNFQVFQWVPCKVKCRPAKVLQRPGLLLERLCSSNQLTQARMTLAPPPLRKSMSVVWDEHRTRKGCWKWEYVFETVRQSVWIRPTAEETWKWWAAGTRGGEERKKREVGRSGREKERKGSGGGVV